MSTPMQLPAGWDSSKPTQLTGRSCASWLAREVAVRDEIQHETASRCGSVRTSPYVGGGSVGESCDPRGGVGPDRCLLARRNLIDNPLRRVPLDTVEVVEEVDR